MKENFHYTRLHGGGSAFVLPSTIKAHSPSGARRAIAWRLKQHSDIQRKPDYRCSRKSDVPPALPPLFSLIGKKCQKAPSWNWNFSSSSWPRLQATFTTNRLHHRTPRAPESETHINDLILPGNFFLLKIMPGPFWRPGPGAR